MVLKLQMNLRNELMIAYLKAIKLRYGSFDWSLRGQQIWYAIHITDTVIPNSIATAMGVMGYRGIRFGREL